MSDLDVTSGVIEPMFDFDFNKLSFEKEWHSQLLDVVSNSDFYTNIKFHVTRRNWNMQLYLFSDKPIYLSYFMILCKYIGTFANKGRVNFTITEKYTLVNLISKYLEGFSRVIAGRFMLLSNRTHHPSVVSFLRPDILHPNVFIQFPVHPTDGFIFKYRHMSECNKYGEWNALDLFYCSTFDSHSDDFCYIKPMRTDDFDFDSVERRVSFVMRHSLYHRIRFVFLDWVSYRKNQIQAYALMVPDKFNTYDINKVFINEEFKKRYLFTTGRILNDSYWQYSSYDVSFIDDISFFETSDWFKPAPYMKGSYLR